LYKRSLSHSWSYQEQIKAFINLHWFLPRPRSIPARRGARAGAGPPTLPGWSRGRPGDTRRAHADGRCPEVFGAELFFFWLSERKARSSYFWRTGRCCQRGWGCTRLLAVSPAQRRGLQLGLRRGSALPGVGVRYRGGFPLPQSPSSRVLVLRVLPHQAASVCLHHPLPTSPGEG